MVYELAYLVKSRDALEQVEAGLHRVFEEGDSGAMRGYDITREIGKAIPTNLHRVVLTILKGVHVLSVVKSSPSVEGTLFSFDRKELSVYMEKQKIAADVITELEITRDNKSTSIMRVVATLPRDWGRMEGVDPTDEAIRRIIIGAQEDLWIVSPYFDDFGKTAVEEALIGRARKGVKIRVVGRQLSQLDIGSNRRSILALQRLARTFKTMNLYDCLEIREFTTRNPSTKATRAGLHSKIVIADRKICYIGSANMTEWSLTRNFEMGVELKGDMPASLTKLVMMLWDDSASINLLEQNLLSMNDLSYP